MENVFKTLSLEERWKNSVHNRQPQKPDLVQSKKTLLQVTGQSLIANTLPSPLIEEPTLLESRERPFVNTSYRRAISLRNRLEQSTTLSSTNHLAQYFLSDQYTDYIKIKPFGIFNHNSTITLEDNAFIPNQGGLDSTPFIFNSLFFQGVVIKNGEITSISNTETPLSNILNYQGAIQVNGNYTSFTNVEQSIPTSQLQQDLNVTVTDPTSVNVIGFSQGLVQVPNGEIGSIAIVDSPGPTPSQGGKDATPFNYEPNRTPATPSVLRYAADRALAYFTLGCAGEVFGLARLGGSPPSLLRSSLNPPT